MSEKDFYLAFSVMKGIGPKKFDLLLRNFGSAKEAWSAPSSSLNKLLKEKLTQKFDDFRNTFDLQKYEDELLKKKISFVSLADKEYPQRLKKIKNPPIVLYVKGSIDFNSDQKCLAIVGTRRITGYGRSVTELFAGSLAQSDLIIVSGLALGVDGVAHVSTIDAGGKTIAVLGNGVDQCYPRENQKIYDKILEGNGAIISEYPPGEPPSIGSFPARNRVVAGLSDGVLVTEGASDSGSLITANFGLEFGRKVFAVPGPITSSLSAAPLRLIEKGAKLVIIPDDVLKELDIKPLSLKLQRVKGETKEEQKIIDLIQNESLQFDEIVGRLKLDSAKTATLLSIMEMKGIVKSNSGNFSLVT